MKIKIQKECQFNEGAEIPNSSQTHRKWISMQALKREKQAWSYLETSMSSSSTKLQISAIKAVNSSENLLRFYKSTESTYKEAYQRNKKDKKMEKERPKEQKNNQRRLKWVCKEIKTLRYILFY